MKPQISIIAGIGRKNRAIGKNNDLLWHIPADMRRFREATFGRPVIMGRKTWESLPERFRPLPNRVNFIVTRQENYKAGGAVIVPNLDQAIESANGLGQEEIFIIGGAEIYRQALPFADRLYLTLVEGDFPDADTFFPEYEHLFTKVIEQEEGEDNGYSYTFLTLEK